MARDGDRYTTTHTGTRPPVVKLDEGNNELKFWRGIYRNLLSIATLIKRHKIEPLQEVDIDNSS